MGLVAAQTPTTLVCSTAELLQKQKSCRNCINHTCTQAGVCATLTSPLPYVRLSPQYATSALTADSLASSRPPSMPASLLATTLVSALLGFHACAA